MTKASDFKALKWRNIGPFLGGRGTCVVGHPTDKQVFYHGHSSGGLWKTEDAGQYWIPVGDGQFNMGSVGAIAISEQNPDIIYVGLGEPQIRNSASWGDGIYKTTDGGATWQHIGLKDSKHIAKIRLHPHNPDLVYVASMGHGFGPSKERGVFRSQDGGQTWENVLFKSENTGCIDLIINPSDPKVIFAAMYEFERKTWGAKTGGPESGLWRSLDGGDTWEDISGNTGMPAGHKGRIGIAMSQAAPNRVYGLIDSETKAGLYRSDDLGVNWSFVSNFAQIIARPFYFFHLFAAPHNADELWAPANKLYSSKDGGETWGLEPGIKDDYHEAWVDPQDPNRIVVTCDGGCQISLTGGKTWSGFNNQPTTQFYRLFCDNQFPYNLYGNPQDTVTVKCPSASRWGGISEHETIVVGNGETGAAIPHPTDPDIVYNLSTGSICGTGGSFTINNLKTGQNEMRPIWPESTFGTPATEFKYRFNWHLPFFLSPHDNKTFYAAGNVVFRSTDEGMSWEKISDDLTNDIQDKQQLAGTSWMGEYFGQEIYSTIFRLEESPHEKGVIWAGSDDGLIHLTKDGGQTWENVTPPNLPEFSPIYEIEFSPHDPGTVYIAITRYRTADDYSPYLYKTTDSGKTWTCISETFPQDEITRTIREDTVRKGLLFVGTETGVFVSIDDGKEWRRLNLNLPRVPVHDIKIKDADLAIATHGRSFWVLDDISPIRQYSEELTQKKAHLFKPETYTRFGYNWWMDYGGGPVSEKKYYFVQNTRPGHTFYEQGVVDGEKQRKFIDAGDSRPIGAIIYYLLSDDAKDVSLSILDEEGNEIQTFSKEDIPTQRFASFDARGYEQDLTTGKPKATVSQGLNRFIWGTRYPSVSSVPGRPPVIINPFAKPGTYQVCLRVDGETQTESFEVKINPNEKYTREETNSKGEFWMKLYAKAEEGIQTVLKAREAKEKVANTLADAADNQTLVDQGAKINALCDELEGSMMPVGTTLVQIINERTKLVPKLTWLHNVLETSEGPANQGVINVYNKVANEMDEVMASFNSQLETEMAQFEQLSS